VVNSFRVFRGANLFSAFQRVSFSLRGALSAAVDNGLEKGHFWAMSYLLTSDLKQHTAKVLAAARKKPQFVFRDGEVFVIRRVVLSDVTDSGGGEMARVIAETWDKLGPAPEIDCDQL
jgi:hypothetical protein